MVPTFLFFCFAYFKGEAISTLNGKFSKFIGQLTYLRSTILSKKSGVNIRIDKVWTAIDRLSIMWKYDLSDKIKREFFQTVVVSVLLYRCTT